VGGMCLADQALWMLNLGSLPLGWMWLSTFWATDNPRLQTASRALLAYGIVHGARLLLLLGQQDEEESPFSKSTTAMVVTNATVLDAHGAEDDASSSRRLLVLYGAASLAWNGLLLFPHWMGTMSRVPESPTCSFLGTLLVAAGLVVPFVPTTAFQLPPPIQGPALVGEVLFWTGITMIHAPAWMGPHDSHYTQYHPSSSNAMEEEWISSSSTPSKKKKKKPSWTHLWFVLFCGWSMVGLWDGPRQEWHMVPSRILARHGILRPDPSDPSALPPPVIQKMTASSLSWLKTTCSSSSKKAVVRGHLGSHHRVHLHSTSTSTSPRGWKKMFG